MPDYEKLFEDLEESIKNKDYAGQLQGTILFNSEAAARQKLAEGGNVFAPSVYSIDDIYNTETQLFNIDNIYSPYVKAKAIQLNQEKEQYEKHVKETEEKWNQFTSIAKPNETLTFKDDPYEYKYNVVEDDEGKVSANYFTRQKDQDAEWTLVNNNEENIDAFAEVVNRFGHLPEDFDLGLLRESRDQRQFLAEYTLLSNNNKALQSFNEGIEKGYFTGFSQEAEDKREADVEAQIEAAKQDEERVEGPIPGLGIFSKIGASLYDPKYQIQEISKFVSPFFGQEPLDFSSQALINKEIERQRRRDKFSDYLLDPQTDYLAQFGELENIKLSREATIIAIQADQTIAEYVANNLYKADGNEAQNIPNFENIGINTQNFIGYLYDKGILEELIEISDDTTFEPGQTRAGFTGILVDDAENLERNQLLRINNQRRLDIHLRNYIQQEVEDHNLKLLANHLSNNFERLLPKGYKGVYETPFEALTNPQIYNLVSDDLRNNPTLQTDNFGGLLFDFEAIQTYREYAFPDLVEQEKLQGKRASDFYYEQDTVGRKLKGFWNSFVNGIGEKGRSQLMNAAGFFGMDSLDTRWRDISYEEDMFINNDGTKDRKWWLQIGDQEYGRRNSAVVFGTKFTDTDGVTYIRDSRGTIYNADTGKVFAGDNPFQTERIIEGLDNSTEKGASTSFVGGIEQFTGVVGGLGYDIAGMYLTRNIGRMSGLSTLTKGGLQRAGLSNIRSIQGSQMLSTASYYGFAGYNQGYMDTYNSAIQAGLSTEEAKMLSQEAANLQGAWWFGTSFLVPTQLYFGAVDKLFGYKAAANAAINRFKEGGKNAFTNSWRKYYSKLSPTGQRTVSIFANFVKGGVGEMGQELTQEVGQKLFINNYLNSIASGKFLDDNFTKQDFVNTAILSFAAGGVISGQGTLDTTNEAYIRNLYLLSKNPTRFKNMLDKAILDGVIDQSNADQLLNDIRAVGNQAFKLKALVDPDNWLEATQILQQIEDIKAENKGADAAIKDGNQQELANLNSKLTLLIANRRDSSVKKIMDQLGYGWKSFDTQEEVDKAIADILNENPNANIDTKNSTDYGTFVTIPEQTAEDGTVTPARSLVLLNNSASSKDFVFTTGQHEGFHGLLNALNQRYKATFQTWLDNGQQGKAPENVVAKMGAALLNELRTQRDAGKIQFTDSELGNRFMQYMADTNLNNDTVLEEIMPLLSEALTRGAVVINEDAGTKIGDVFRRFLQKYLGFNFVFENGKDVLNLVRDYNRAVDSGKGLTRGLKSFGEGNVTVGGDIAAMTTEDTAQSMTDFAGVDRQTLQAISSDFDGDIQTDSKASKRLTDLAVDFQNELKNNPEAQPSRDLRAQYTAASLAALRRWGAQRGVTFNFYDGNQLSTQGREALSAINNQFADIMRTYKPVVNGKKVELTTYLDQAIGPRVGVPLVEEATRTQQEVSTDVLTEKGFSPQTTTQPDLDVKTQPIGKRAKVFPNKIKTISDNITGETRADQIVMLKNDIIEGILRVGPKPKAIAKYIVEKTKTKEYRKLIKDKLGVFGSQQYIDNVNALFSNTDFISAIPVANIKRRFGKLFGISKTGTIPTVKIEEGKETRYDKGVYNIPAITDAKLARIKNYFLAEDGEKRSQSLFSIIGEGLAVEAIQELSTDPEFMKELENRLSFRNSNINAEQFMSELEFELDKRNLEDKSLDTVRASKKFNTDVLIKIAAAKTIDSGLTELNINKLAEINTAEGLKTIQSEIEKHIKEYGIDETMFLGFSLANSGRFYESRNGIKYFKLRNGKFVKENSRAYKNAIKLQNQGRTTNESFMPARGRLYYGSNDPEYIRAMDLAKANNTDNTLKRASKVTVNQVINKKWFTEGYKGRKGEKFSRDSVFDNNMEVLQTTALRLEQAVKDGMPIEYAALLITQSYQATSGMIKTSAKFKYVHTDLKQGQEFREEHNPPASVIGINLIYAIQQQGVRSMMKDIRKNYYQTQIPIANDTEINNAGYQSVLPDGTDITTNSAIRLIKAGQDLNKYVDPITGNTLAEDLGLPLKPADRNTDNITLQRNLAEKIIMGTYDGTLKDAQAELKAPNKTNKLSSKQIITNKNTLFPLINANGDTEASIKAMTDADKTMRLANKYSKKKKGISVFDFDDTLAFSKSKVIVEMPNGKFKEITPAEFAAQAEQLQAEGATFDFSQFDKVIKGRKGPLADLALKRQAKFGSGDIFVLTARPQISAPAIKLFLDSIGLNIPLENITGLADGSPDAKALWILDKTAQGYNDFYFADDSLPNVQAVKNILDQVDVKSDVQQAKASKKADLDKDFNIIIEKQSGKEWYKTYSRARARVQGRRANKFEFFIPPSAEDFTGLLYKLLPKGEDGNRAMQWFKDNLIDPFNKAEQEIIAAKISVANDFNALRNSLDNIPDNLQDKAGYSDFTFSQALRVYIWNMQGMEIPGLSTRDKNALVKLINDNPDLKVFAEKIAFIQKGKSYPSPSDNWVAGSITGDIINSIQKTYRKEALADWQQNVDIIFSEKNMNKLEAIYGSNFVVALKNILGRMKSGSNRTQSGNPQVDNVVDWINNSVGTTMFLNRKSALLQLISNINFINWSDNNLLAAGKAFANQPQYWKDVMFLLNSDYLVQRRNGMKINVAESEIAEASKKGGLKGVIAYLLNKGFVFTRIADSLAIATGGATFYRNRVNRLLKTVNIDTGKLYTQQEAETKAFDDFYKISEESQQSSRADRISMQQASGLGRVVLNYANTPMQYARIIKKATKDLLAGRGDWKTNVSKILYYGFVQNLIFNSLQQALFALAFGDEEEQKKAGRTAEDRATNIGFGMLSSLLRGLGYGGALVDTLISMSREISIREDGLPDFGEDFAWNIFDFSPTIDTKVRKIRSVRKTFKYNRDEIKRRGFSIENPAYYSLAQIIDAGFNLPLDRALRMTMSLMQISDRDTSMWQRFALSLGWSSWSVGLPFWGTLSTLKREKKEDEEIKTKYDNDTRKLKTQGFKRVPMTGPKSGRPSGKLGEDYIEMYRPNGKLEYWLMPKK